MLATGGSAADTAANYFSSCSTWNPALARTICVETSTAAAFGFLGWLSRKHRTSHIQLTQLTPYVQSVGLRRHAPCPSDPPSESWKLRLAAVRQRILPGERQCTYDHFPGVVQRKQAAGGHGPVYVHACSHHVSPDFVSPGLDLLMRLQRGPRDSEVCFLDCGLLCIITFLPRDCWP